jgi:hypothetical protein
MFRMSRDRLLFVTTGGILLSALQVRCFEISVEVRRMLEFVVQEVTVMAGGTKTLSSPIRSSIMLRLRPRPVFPGLRKRPLWNRYAGSADRMNSFGASS